jgi:hypothetical protein
MSSPLFVLKSSPPNSSTDPDGLRHYTWMGVKYPSVTTVRRMAGVSFNIFLWTIGKIVDRAVDDVAGLNRRIINNDPLTLKEAKAWLREASTDERDKAADLGTRVHDAATSGRAPGEVSPDVRPFLIQYRDWLEETGVKVLTVERQIYNLTLGYAGTFDLLVRFPNGQTYVVDLKTGKGTYSEHALQCVAYAMGEFVGENDVIDEKATRLLLEADGIALLHLRPDGWTWQVIHATPDLFSAFRGLLTFATWAHRNKKIDTLLESEVKGHA